MKKGIFLFLIVMCFSSLVWADFSTELKTAREAYYNKDYTEAKNQFESLLQNHPQNPYLWFHLGDTFQKLDQSALALHAYLKAQKSLPRSPELSANVSLLSQSVSYQPFGWQNQAVSSVYFWQDFLSLSELRLILSLIFILLWGLWWFKRSRSGGVFKVIFFVLLFYFTLAWGFAEYKSLFIKQALALGDHPAYSTYQDGSEPLFQVRAGEALHIIDSQDLGDELWLRVLNKDGQKGWLLQSLIGRV